MSGPAEAEVPGRRFQAAHDRFASADGLVLHDTNAFSCQRRRPEPIGRTCRVNSGHDQPGRYRQHPACGPLMHASLAATGEGLPPGLAAVKFWTRRKFSGTAALKRKIDPTRVPIERKEGIRWLGNMRRSQGAVR